MDKRTFLKSTAIAGAGSLVALSALGRILDGAAGTSAGELAEDENFWASIRAEYQLSSDFINLESGYYNIMPDVVMESYFDRIRHVNREGAHYMRTVQFDNKKRVVEGLAQIAGCKPEELIITRNTTESLDMVISGFDWKAGDEAVMAEQDYGAMLDMFRQVGRRYGVVNKMVSIPLHPAGDEEIVQLYANAITPKTRLLMVCHMINITGQILPVRKICDMAHSRGVQVMVDGAHAFAHIEYKIPELCCDYYGASLHKWLAAPLGAGILYVRPDRVKEIWPLFAENGRADNDILRLNHTGTHPVATDITIPYAIEFYRKIGAARKETRLRYLQQYWTGKVRHLPDVLVNTPQDAARCCAIANVGIRGMKPADMAKTLLDKYNIYTVAIDNAGVHGCRVTPNVFTTTGELDKLVEAIRQMAT